MKKNAHYLFIFMLSLLAGETLANDQPNLKWLENWFSAWALLSDTMQIPLSEPPTMLFYDEKYVYTTSSISAPNGESFDGPLFLGKKLPWLRAIHNDSLIIPDGKKVPVRLMTFAAPTGDSKTEAFFVMAAPSFWQKAGIKDEDVGLEKLLTGVFLHEFAHTRQMNGIGARVSPIENKLQDKKLDVNDDMIQQIFSKDTAYVRTYLQEVNTFYQASITNNISDLKSLTQKGLTLLRERHAKYLRPKQAELIELDHIFLTMEGLGQYMIVEWLSHPKGGGVERNIAIKATRRERESWSQDEGLALFLIFKRLNPNPNWREDMFSSNLANIVSLIEKEL